MVRAASEAAAAAARAATGCQKKLLAWRVVVTFVSDSRIFRDAALVAFIMRMQSFKTGTFMCVCMRVHSAYGESGRR